MIKDFILNYVTVAVQKSSTEKIVKKESELDGIERFLMIPGTVMDDGKDYKIDERLLDSVGIETKEIWERAEKNLHENVFVYSLNDFFWQEVVDVPIVVVTTKNGRLGASAALDRRVLKEIGNKFSTHELIILPSSIHEMLILPNPIGCLEDYTKMVEKVNKEEVIPEDRLTDRAYKIEI